MQMQSISPKAKTLWLIRNAIILAILTVAAGFGLLGLSTTPGAGAAMAVVILLWLCAAVLLLLWPGLKYKNYRYSYDEKRFCLHFGVIFKHQITAPVCQIQDLHLVEGPIMRLLGLGSILLSTGGSSFSLDCLEKQLAQTIIEDMEEKLRSRIEVQRHEEV